ncbi:MAG: type III-A CRISPR-associated RAMP protein Csm3 [Endomicrobiia bacterium]
MKLLKYKKISGIITCLTGLHIGGSSEKIEIGGVDNPIIRSPVDDFPYIPGSSIKGKMRTLLEWKLEKVEPNGEVHGSNRKNPCKDKNCPICCIFGTSAGQETDTGPTRLIVRDAKLTDASREMLKKLKEEKGLPYAEEKYENTINRITAEANPRQMERVPAGTQFEFEMVYRVFDENNDNGKRDEELFENVKLGLELLQQDYLGGSGSRGYGKIKIEYEIKDINLE